MTSSSGWRDMLSPVLPPDGRAYLTALFEARNNATTHCNEYGEFPGADGYPIDDGDFVYVVSPIYFHLLDSRVQQVDEFHGGRYNPIFQTRDDKFDMLSTQVISMYPHNPTIRRITKLQRMWRAIRLRRITKLRRQRLGIMMATKLFESQPMWTRWLDFHNRRWWAYKDEKQWFYEDQVWTVVHANRFAGRPEHSALLYQETSGARMLLWKLLSITAPGMVTLIIRVQSWDSVMLRAVWRSGGVGQSELVSDN